MLYCMVTLHCIVTAIEKENCIVSVLYCEVCYITVLYCEVCIDGATQQVEKVRTSLTTKG